MLFNSYSFLLFCPVVVLFYFALPQRIRWVWLLVASYYFYMSWNAQYVILFSISVLITWISGILINWSNKKGGERSIIEKEVVDKLTR
jgi:D-alanyl-lipoteichoic acid acyltransferase DltB (MBOAT superfamily)